MFESIFAQVDENNIVTNVAVVTKEFLEANPDRYTGRWVETSGAAIGFTYIEETKNLDNHNHFLLGLGLMKHGLHLFLIQLTFKTIAGANLL